VFVAILVNPLAVDDAVRRRRDHWRAEGEKLRDDETGPRQGGGPKALEKQRQQGKLTARERVAGLLDPDSDFLELGLWAAHGMYAEWGGGARGAARSGMCRD